MAGTRVQRPTEPGTMHDRQVSVHSVSQQIASTQEPDSQSPSAAQLEPFARRRSHTPLGAQNVEPGHSPSVHVVAQVVASWQ
jgi:hypothetical protein